MRVYRRLPEMLKWKKFFMWFSIAATFICCVHVEPFLIVMSLICLFFFAFLTAAFVLANFIMGDSNDLSFIFKMHWYEERKIDSASIVEVTHWCMENLEDKWRETGRGYFLIKNDTDAMAFKLRWS